MQTPAGIKNAMSAITHGVYVLGVHTPEKDNLMTAAWLCQVSSAPPTLAVAVSSKHLTTQLISQAGGFAVSVLSEEQRETALRNGSLAGTATSFWTRPQCPERRATPWWLKPWPIWSAN